MWTTNSIISILLLPYFVAPEESSVYNYTPDNFKKQVEGMDGNFIMFYAPWCRHCTDFHPIWQELAELVNTPESKFAIAQVDCTEHHKLCNDNDITGYPTLLYFHKNTFQPVEYKGTRDLPALTLFLSEVFTMKAEGLDVTKTSPEEVTIYSGMAYLNDQNVEKFLSKGQHFVMFYASWCKASQKLAPIWAELAVQYAHNEYVQIGKINCMDSQMTCQNFDVKQYPYLLWIVNGRILQHESILGGADNFTCTVDMFIIKMGVAIQEDDHTLEDLKGYVDKMMLSENHDPEKFMKKKKVLPVARITEETFETFLEKDIVFVNYFAPWCAHCMQLSPLWTKLGQRFQNETRVLIADVDCASSKHICLIEKISGLPTLVLYKQKKIVSTENGGKPLESLVALVQEQLDLLSAPPEKTTESPSSSEDNTRTEKNASTSKIENVVETEEKPSTKDEL